MRSGKEKGRLASGPRKTNDIANVPARAPRRKPIVQPQLFTLLWLSRQFPTWWSKRDHAQMLWRVFERVIREEAAE